MSDFNGFDIRRGAMEGYTYDDGRDALRRPVSLQRSTHEDKEGEGGGTAPEASKVDVYARENRRNGWHAARRQRATDGSVPVFANQGPGMTAPAAFSACVRAGGVGGTSARYWLRTSLASYGNLDVTM